MRRGPQSRVVLFILLMVSLAVPAFAVTVPYADQVSATITAVTPTGPNTLRLDFQVTSGSGTPTGPFTSVGHIIADVTNPTGFIPITGGSNVITTSGGEQININITGNGLTPTANPQVYNIQITTVFTGGTGQYTGATGGFTGQGVVNLPAPGVFLGATFMGTGAGTISAPGILSIPTLSEWALILLAAALVGAALFRMST